MTYSQGRFLDNQRRYATGNTNSVIFDSNKGNQKCNKPTREY